MAERNEVSEQEIYLHGDIEIKIVEARSLPDLDLVLQNVGLRFFSICTRCTNMFEPDAYVAIQVPGATVARTRVISNSKNPKWNQQLRFALAHPLANLELQVKDDDPFGAKIIGRTLIPARQIASGDPISGWFPVIGPNEKPPKEDTAIRLEVKFTPAELNPLYRSGIAGDPEESGVRNTYFPLRKGGALTLYQDAHVPNGLLPEIELEDGRVFEHGKCWEDLCHAISEAHHLVYVVGWSIYDKIRLVREPTRPLPRGGDLTLGELLKYKSEEGVRVLMLVWDDKTSHDKFFIKTEGVMRTHDEETRKFFKHSSVICVLSPRYASNKLGIIKRQVVGTVFTHHQKCVLVDTHAHGGNRKITAFIGGLDLCDGRYDTPQHRLFHDLDTVFKNDFHNPTLSSNSKGPRQPWHDLHCKIEGPAAYDVLLNFEQRWRKATKWSRYKLLCFQDSTSHWHHDALLKIERISWILTPPLTVMKDGKTTSIPKDDPKLYVSSEDDPKNWHIQIFRSIDSGAVKGFPKTFELADRLNLAFTKNLVIDKSIQTAYIQAIRSAQRFIYIENQYFLGSSYGWPSYKDAGADNLIPMELALKIASKIRAKENFAVYIVIPMWPEGDPKSASVQEILYWQSQTMEMMYRIVARELKSMKIFDSHPTDYLNFYCLGNREELPSVMLHKADQPSGEANSNSVSDPEKFQRFMIYIHAKGMIVDDEYIILGSANINQRSMAGTKDTEIAMGAYQPHYTWTRRKKHPYGQIYGYRMSLWAEHLGKVDKWFHNPESLECVKVVNDVAEDNWTRFTAESFTPLKGHLLKYPLKVDADGKIGPWPGVENFPDVGGKVIGADSIALPDTLTT